MWGDALRMKAEVTMGAFSLKIDAAPPLTGITAIFGPSGAGKSSLLRLIAGFQRPDHGRIFAGERCWVDTERRVFVAPHLRGVGYMFQDGRLFPHLTARENLAFAEKRSRHIQSAIRQDDIIDIFQLGGLLDRREQSLSGGEKQRVALARTLLARPSLLLLDEPFAGLDRSRKTEIMPFLETLPDAFHLPIFLVSHDVNEVCRLAGSTLAMQDGRIAAFGATETVLSANTQHPALTGLENYAVLPGRVLEHDREYQLTRLKVGDDVFSLPIDETLAPASETRFVVRSQDVSIALSKPEDISIRNAFAGEIVEIRNDPETPYADIRIHIAAGHLLSRLTRAAVAELKLAPGLSVFALIKSAAFDLHEGD